MAFKKTTKEAFSYKHPAEIFRDLTRRKYPDVLPYQLEIMKKYVEVSESHSDIAFQLPTGSGKTLIGLLIAEWRRRKYNERVIYLCPTKQLANQVAEQAADIYDIPAVLLVGSQKDFLPTDSTAYKQADKIAITTYSALFNINPFFKDADIILLDDAHTSENYISSQWSMAINKEEHRSCYNAICSLLQAHVDYITIINMKEDDSFDKDFIDMLPVSIKTSIEKEFIDLLDIHTKDIDLSYKWKSIRTNLDACQIYLSSKEILIRPLIPPTFTHHPFNNAKQRIYMSATLGKGGDLERTTGRNNIYRIPAVESLGDQGVGRRFFIFPEMSLNENETRIMRDELLKLTSKSVFLVPNNKEVDNISSTLDDSIRIFRATDIENTKQEFRESPKASAILANRYDGIDFPGDECRLLFIQGLPKAVNLQERFILSQMGSHILYNERIQNRIIQAIGRCTRSLQDYAAVVITGEGLADYLTDRKFIKYLQPELQAEILFGIEQSKNTSTHDFIENFEIFIANKKEWNEANQQIIESRNNEKQENLPCLEDLSNICELEIKYQRALWTKNYLEASDIATSIIGKITHGDLRGYRALWHYFAGYAEYLESISTDSKPIMAKAVEHFKEAHKAAPFIRWLTKLQKLQDIEDNSLDNKLLLQTQINKISSNLSSLGSMSNRNYEQKEKSIRDGLKNPETFENAQKDLGNFIGFIANNSETRGSPDPWWICENYCIVFEDYVNTNKEQCLNINKVRQAASHPNWIRENIFKGDNNVIIIPVLVSPVKYIECEAKVHADNLYFWALDDFYSWVDNTLSIMRELRAEFHNEGDLTWLAEKADFIKEKKIDFLSIINMIKENPVKKVLVSK